MPSDTVDDEDLENAARALLDSFGMVVDRRREHRRFHPLPEVLFVTVVGVLCGADNPVVIERVCEGILPWLRRFSPFEHGVASHDTITRVFGLLSPSSLGAVLTDAAERLFRAGSDRHVAMDGKVARRSFSDGDRNTAIHMVTAWASDLGICLGQVATDSKSNEQTAILKLAELLDLRGCVVTIDAQGCQKKIAAALSDAGADYILALKDNHPTLHGEVREFFELLEGHDTDYTMSMFRTTDGGHGRVEERRYCLTESVGWQKEQAQWAGLVSFGMVESRRHIGEAVSLERRYFLTTLPESDVAEFASAQRRHWGVENGLHWVLDVGLREDESRVRTGHAATNLAMLRRLVVSTLRRDKTIKVGAQGKRLRAAVDEEYRTKLVAQVFAEAG